MNSMGRGRKLGLILLGVALAGPACCQVVVLLSPLDFQTPTVLVDFENYPAGGQVPYSSSDLDLEWLDLGVRFGDDSTADGISAYSGTFSLSPVSGSRAVADSVNAAGGYVEIRFVVPGTTTPTLVLEAGIWVLNGDQPSTVTFFDASGAVIQTLTPAAGTSFAGLRAGQGIASMRIVDPDFYLVDDLQFTAVPEPGSVALLGAGLLLLGLARRR